jgi:outer membrane protein assembly factor BamB
VAVPITYLSCLLGLCCGLTPPAPKEEPPDLWSRTHRKWRLRRVPEGFSSPVIIGGYLYRLCNPETLRYWKLADGAEVFQERLPGVSTASSPFTTPEGGIYFASAGKSYVVKAGAKLDVLAVNDLADGSQASPAVAEGCIFLKGRKQLYCIGNK